MSIQLENQPTITRSPHDRLHPFCQISNEMLHDRSISPKAKGILSYLLSLKDDWEIYHSHLMYALNCGETYLNSGLEELISAGYARRERKRNSKGHFTRYAYEISEFKRFLPNAENQPGLSSLDNTVLQRKNENEYLRKQQQQSMTQADTEPENAAAFGNEAASPVVVVSFEKKDPGVEMALPASSNETFQQQMIPESIQCEEKTPSPDSDISMLHSHSKCKHFKAHTNAQSPTSNIHPQASIKTEPQAKRMKPLTEDQKCIVAWLDFQDIGASYDTLTYWVCRYPLPKICEAVSELNDAKEKGSVIKNPPGFIRAFLDDKIAFRGEQRKSIF